MRPIRSVLAAFVTSHDDVAIELLAQQFQPTRLRDTYTPESLSKVMVCIPARETWLAVHTARVVLVQDGYHLPNCRLLTRNRE